MVTLADFGYISSVLTANTNRAKMLSIIQVSNREHYFLSKKKD
jgi:hypothetical protein